MAQACFSDYNISFLSSQSWIQKDPQIWIVKLGSRDTSVVRAPDSWSKGRGFKSLLEWWENFLLQGQLSVLTLISVSVPPPCYRSSTQKSPVILPKVQVAGYSETRIHLTYVTLHEVTWCIVVWCTQKLRWDGSSFMWHQPCQRCEYTTSVDI